MNYNTRAQFNRGFKNNVCCTTLTSKWNMCMWADMPLNMWRVINCDGKINLWNHANSPLMSKNTQPYANVILRREDIKKPRPSDRDLIPKKAPQVINNDLWERPVTSTLANCYAVNTQIKPCTRMITLSENHDHNMIICVEGYYIWFVPVFTYKRQNVNNQIRTVHGFGQFSA